MRNYIQIGMIFRLGLIHWNLSLLLSNCRYFYAASILLLVAPRTFRSFSAAKAGGSSLLLPTRFLSRLRITSFRRFRRIRLLWSLIYLGFWIFGSRAILLCIMEVPRITSPWLQCRLLCEWRTICQEKPLKDQLSFNFPVFVRFRFT